MNLIEKGLPHYIMTLDGLGVTFPTESATADEISDWNNLVSTALLVRMNQIPGQPKFKWKYNQGNGNIEVTLKATKAKRKKP